MAKEKFSQDVNQTRSIVSSVRLNAFFMGLGVFFSRISGLLREQVFAYFFGAGSVVDAFQIAFRIPNLLRDLFAEGAMSSAFVPVFVKVKENKGKAQAWLLASKLFLFLFIFVGFLSGVGILFSDELVGLFASSFKAESGKFELTVLLTQVMFPFFPLVALAAAFMGVLNACGRFFMPAFASALFNLSSVGLGLLIGFQMEHPIVGMAIGVVIGGGVQAFSQWPGLKKIGFKFSIKKPFWDSDLKKIVILLLPGMAGLAATQINVLVNSILATSLGTGTVAWLQYAFRLMQFPIGVFGVSIASASLPVLSAHWVKKEYHEGIVSLEKSLRQVFALCLPATVGLMVLSVPIIELLFQYGKFTYRDTIATAQALQAYAVGLTAYAVVKVLVPSAYVFERVGLAIVASIATVGVTIAWNILSVERLGFAGLAVGTSVGAFFNAIFLFWVVRAQVKKRGVLFSGLKLSGSFLLFFFISSVIGVVLYGVDRSIGEALSIQLSESFGFLVGRSVRVFLALGVTGVLLLFFGLLGVPEYEIKKIIKRIPLLRNHK